MAEIDASYQAKVGREQGGNRFYMKADGEFKFYDDDLTGLQLRTFLQSRMNVRYIIGSGTGLSGPATLSQYATYIFLLSTGASLVSCNLPSAVRGAQLVLNGSGVAGDGNIIADGSVTGDSFYGQDGVTALSSLNLSAVFYAVLTCHTEGIWQVAEGNGSVSERAAA